MITLPNIAGHKYAVLGLAKSGMATAASLVASQADVSVWDDNPEARASAALAGYRLVDLVQADLTGFKALVLAPGIPLTHPSPHPVVQRCQASHVPVIGDIDLLFQACPEATYVGITGTNGKSTTTALIGHVLKQTGRKVQTGGNLGTPALSLESYGKGGIYVLELSSYQLALIHQNLLRIAVFLNIMPDHLDRHGDMRGYFEAKKRIISTTTPQTVILGTDEEEMQALLSELRHQRHLQVEEISVHHAVTQGVMAAGQQLFAYHNGEGRPIANLDTLKTLRGKHNAQNACAAFAACHALGVPTHTIGQYLKTFPGLAHRQQRIADIDGVTFINDSKATNANAAEKALACYQNIYWIIGGKPKEGGLNGLESYAPRIRHAFIIGQASEAFAQWCEKNAVPHTLCGILDIATEKAAAMAWHDKEPEAVVLLSPACASWDQFNNFEERGDLFALLVKKLSDPARTKVAL
jgi:UDP-N-acetylmuramoylalanine--D-glutamate ligase